ncbi:MAG: protein kinase, partial [Nanoarchaeota archaeon]
KEFEYKYIYREMLAAKTLKSQEFNEQFVRELNIWINISEKGSVPLLKIIKDNKMVFGIMPFYNYNLREVLEKGTFSSIKLLSSFKQCIECLKNIYEKYKIIHLDLKPENILVQVKESDVDLKLSDWGIANLISDLLLKHEVKELNSIRTIVGAGTLPYMAPERLLMNKPDIQSDIFSIGMIFYEILFTGLPYNNNFPIEDQLLSSSYYEIAMQNLWKVKDKNLRNLIVEMLHPDKSLRTSSYKRILKQLNKIKV